MNSKAYGRPTDTRDRRGHTGDRRNHEVEAKDNVLDVARPDATVNTFSEWRVADADRQQPTMHAAIDAWKDFAWPDGLLSHLRQPDETVQRDWIDTVLDPRTPVTGGTHRRALPSSTDHSHIVNLAEWTSAQAHRDELDGVTGGINRDDDRRWQLVRDHPGISDLSRFTRYPAWRTLSATRS